MANAYKGVIILESEGYLLGGGKRAESFPFSNREDALAWAEQAANTNWNRPGYELANIVITVHHAASNNPIQHKEVL